MSQMRKSIKNEDQAKSTSGEIYLWLIRYVFSELRCPIVKPYSFTGSWVEAQLCVTHEGRKHFYKCKHKGCPMTYYKLEQANTVFHKHHCFHFAWSTWPLSHHSFSSWYPRCHKNSQWWAVWGRNYQTEASERGTLLTAHSTANKNSDAELPGECQREKAGKIFYFSGRAACLVLWAWQSTTRRRWAICHPWHLVSHWWWQRDVSDFCDIKGPPIALTQVKDISCRCNLQDHLAGISLYHHWPYWPKSLIPSFWICYMYSRRGYRLPVCFQCSTGDNRPCPWDCPSTQAPNKWCSSCNLWWVLCFITWLWATQIWNVLGSCYDECGQETPTHQGHKKVR